MPAQGVRCGQIAAAFVFVIAGVRSATPIAPYVVSSLA